MPESVKRAGATTKGSSGATATAAQADASTSDATTSSNQDTSTSSKSSDKSADEKSLQDPQHKHKHKKPKRSRTLLDPSDAKSPRKKRSKHGKRKKRRRRKSKSSSDDPERRKSLPKDEQRIPGAPPPLNLENHPIYQKKAKAGAQKPQTPADIELPPELSSTTKQQLYSLLDYYQTMQDSEAEGASQQQLQAMRANYNDMQQKLLKDVPPSQLDSLWTYYKALHDANLAPASDSSYVKMGKKSPDKLSEPRLLLTKSSASGKYNALQLRNLGK